MKIIERNALSSNLKIILAPMAGAKTVTGYFSCRAGWRYEGQENNGIAHFLEHMAFKGTKNRPTTLDITKEVHGKGGMLNANTSEEITNYFIRLPYQFTENVCDILSDMLLNSLLSPEEIEKEKGTIIQELHGAQDDPSSCVGFIAWPKLLYGDQPAGRCGVGTEESIKAMTRDHFVEFLENLYTDENTVFCLAGKIPDAENAFTTINNLFFPMKEGEAKIKKPPVTENQQESAILLESRDIKQSNLVLGVRAYNFCHLKEHILEVLDVILGGNMSSRLFTEVREKRGLAYHISTFTDCQSDVGTFGALAGVNSSRALEAITVIMDEYKKLCDEKVPDEELQRAKDYIIGASQMSFESPISVARYVAHQWVMKGEITSFEKEAKKIKAVTAEDIQSVAQEIFVNKGLNLAIVGPHKEMEEEFLKILKF